MEDEIETLPDEEESSTTDKHIWDQGMTLCLIDEYRNHLQDFLYPQGRMIKDIWEKISLNMHAKGYGVSSGCCDQKWRQLKKTFKHNQPNAGKKSKAKWVFFEALKDILDNDEITKRIHWKPRSTSKPEIKSSPEYVQNESLKDEAISVCPLHENTAGSRNCNKKQENPPKWFQHFLSQYQEDEERKRKMMQKMHSDLIALERQKCILLENVIKKIPKNETIPQIVGAVSLSQEMFDDDDKFNHTFSGV